MRRRIFGSEKCLTDALLLAVPSRRGSLVIYTEVSKDGLECILKIRGEVMVYASRKFKYHERR